MSTNVMRPTPAAIDAPTGVRRLLDRTDLPQTTLLPGHRQIYTRPGSVRRGRTHLIKLVEQAGLRGRGGAAFPTATKLRAVAEGGRRSVVVVNGTEGEPASRKDAMLLQVRPHLVLDGATHAAASVGASEIYVCIDRQNGACLQSVGRALQERRQYEPDAVAVTLLATPPRYVAGEESALVHWLNDQGSMPQYRPTRPHIQHVGRSAVLVVNAETNAHVGLINRFGAEWFREAGTEQSPGTTLVAVSGAVERPVVLEVPLGIPLRSLLHEADADSDPQAILLGGYGGAWLGAEHLDSLYCNEALRPLGASVGAGILVVVPRVACGLSETLRIVEWMANESARQCGPCAFGLPAIAKDLSSLLRGSHDSRAILARVKERCSVIEGRGACRHPDGVVRLVKSALQVFSDDVEAHVGGVPCVAAGSSRRWVAVPAMEPESDLVWE